MNIHKIKQDYEEDLFKRKNVVGISVGNKIVKNVDTKCLSIRIYVEKKLPFTELSPKDVIPLSVETAITDVIEIGKIELQNFKKRNRPTMCGISIGHHKITAGTLGCLVRDNVSKETLILSNNHVLAMSNRAKIGDEIVQPGAYDNGVLPEDLVGHLLRFIKIHPNPPFWMFWKKTIVNVVDCAVCKPVVETSPKIMKIGTPQGIATVKEGETVQKSGRTTGYTKGEVIDTDATIKVNYGKFIGRFKHQILTKAMSAGGDSGSLVLDMKKKAIGLLYAGSKKITILNPIKDILTLLDVEIISAK